MNRLRPQHFTLVTRCSPDECVERLRWAVVSFRGWSWLYGWLVLKPFSGELTSNRIRLRPHNRPQSFYQLTLTASLESADGETRLHCRIAPAFGRAVLVWFVFAALTSAIALRTISHPWLVREMCADWSVWGAPLALAFLLWNGVRRGPMEAAELEAILIEWLAARRE